MAKLEQDVNRSFLIVTLLNCHSPNSLSEKERREKINLCSPPEDISRKKIIKNPIDPRDRNAWAAFSGSNRANILDPSNGGMGRRLKIASKRLRRTMPIRINDKGLRIKFGERGISFKTKLAIIAITTLVKGPDKETMARSFLPSLRLKGSTGTGLAAPIIIGDPEINRMRGRAMLIMGSICFLGLRVNRPASLAVGSPRRSATYP